MISTQEVPTRDRAQTKPGSRAKLIGIGGVVLLALVAIGAVPRIASHREALAAVREAPVTHPVVSISNVAGGNASTA